MKYRQLGKNGPSISLVGLGCNNFGNRSDIAATRKVVDSAIDHGITFFDTADSYGEKATSEEFLGQILGPRRQKIVLATKFGNAIKGVMKEKPRTTKAYVISACEASLKRLKTDYIDLYQMHYPDPSTPIDEALDSLDKLVKQGKVRHIGCSNFSTAQVEAAEQAAKKVGIGSFISCQNEYSLLERQESDALRPALEAKGIGLLPYAPLAGGLLSGKYRSAAPLPAGTRLGTTLGGPRLNESNLKVVDALSAFAATRGQTMLNLAFGWLAAQPWVSCVMAGAMTPAQVEQNAAAIDWIPSAAEMQEIDRLAPVKPGRRG